MTGTRVKLAMLNVMAGKEIADSLGRQQDWGLTAADLKDSIFGKSIANLTDEEAHQLSGMLAEHHMEAHCLSTVCFWEKVEAGEKVFVETHLRQVERAVAVGRILKAECIRLIAPATSRRAELADAPAYLRKEHPWIFRRMAEGVGMIHDAGMEAVIENEIHGCVIGSGQEVNDFFAALGAPAGFIWDIQNMWENGAYPSIKTYEAIKPHIKFVHLKGGVEDPVTRKLKYASSLADATWPVLEITRQVIRDGKSAVICLNPSHGEKRPGYDALKAVQEDITFLRSHFKEIE